MPNQHRNTWFEKELVSSNDSGYRIRAYEYLVAIQKNFELHSTRKHTQKTYLQKRYVWIHKHLIIGSNLERSPSGLGHAHHAKNDIKKKYNSLRPTKITYI